MRTSIADTDYGDHYEELLLLIKFQEEHRRPSLLTLWFWDERLPQERQRALSVIASWQMQNCREFVCFSEAVAYRVAGFIRRREIGEQMEEVLKIFAGIAGENPWSLAAVLSSLNDRLHVTKCFCRIVLHPVLGLEVREVNVGG